MLGIQNSSKACGDTSLSVPGTEWAIFVHAKAVFVLIVSFWGVQYIVLHIKRTSAA